MTTLAVPRESQTSLPTGGTRLALLLIVGLLLLRAVYAMGPDLFPEEAYYWNYSEHLALGYLDHPPLVGWLIRLGTEMFDDGEFGVRFFALVCSVITAGFAYGTTAFFFGRRAGVMGALLVQVLPFFFMTGLIMTPDSSLTACWTGMLYFLVRVLFARQSRAWWGVGVCLGLGMLSKYTIALLGPATLLFLALDPASRVWFRKAAPYGAVLLAILLFSPVIVWNARHQWASFAFQPGNRIAEPMAFSFHQLAASVLLFLTPVGIILAVKSLRGRVELPEMRCEPARFLLFTRVFVLVPLAVFVLFSLTHPVKLNWTGPLWLALVPMLAVQLASVRPGSSWLLRRGWPATVAVLALVYFALLHYLALGIPNVAYTPNMELLPVGWSEMGHELTHLKEDCEKAHGKTLIVGLDRNFIASEAAFYQTDQDEGVRETAGAHLLGGNGLMFEKWFPSQEQEGLTLLLVSFQEADLKRKRIAKQCGTLGPIEQHWIERDGDKIRPFYTRIAQNYRAKAR